MSYPYGMGFSSGMPSFDVLSAVNLAPGFPVVGNGLGGLPQRGYDNSPLAIGIPYEGGFFAGQISTSGTGVANYNLIVGPASTANTTALLKTTNTSTPDTSSPIDGLANTEAMILEGAAIHPAASFCYNLTIGGYEDWYLPAINELQVIYTNLKPVTTANTLARGINPNSVPRRWTNYTPTNPLQTRVPSFIAGGANAFLAANYWSSSEVIGNATSNFRNAMGIGYTAGVYKNTSLNLRAIRRVPA